ncbi:hypothetical protein [Paenibacillus antibioticophila]|uniref:hypothetical protein n=1 Tax=Paenibacillus antibioticophila TaxID=1274374 RepID=UPI0005C85E1B|nr:hypothetical protein [Paenibacillus antibioticophila]
MLFINFYSGLTVVAIVLILSILYKGEFKNRLVLKDIGSYVQSISIVIAVGYSLVVLSEMGGIQDFSEKLHYSLLLIFYGVLINILLNFYIRITKKALN